MKVTLVGSGYVGLVTGACLAEIGNSVVCVDVDDAKIKDLNAGRVPIYEPGLEDLIARNCAAGRLQFTTDIEKSVFHGDVQFIAVGTPPDEDGSADLRYVIAAARNIGRTMTGFKVIVNKSTVPVGTAGAVSAAVTEELVRRGFAAERADRRELGHPDFTVVSNPEFLKEGAAVEDFMRPDRIVVGVDGDVTGEEGLARMRRLYAPFNRSHDKTIVMDVASAEFTKYAANAMLATRISFMNELANLAESVGADIELVRHGIGSDPRIGYSFLYAGAGYGGSCFPKDVQALIRTAQTNGRELKVLRAVEAVNDAQKLVLLHKVLAFFGEDLAGRRLAIWGLAFKPNTDDMREAPSRVLIRELVRRGATVVAYDPVAMVEAERCLAQDLKEIPGGMACVSFAASPFEALAGADGLVLVTEWKAFRSPDFPAMKAALRRPIIIDGRNQYERAEVEAAGLIYEGVGRGARSTTSTSGFHA